MEAVHGERTPTTTRLIVYAGLVAACYALLTIVLAPISFGPLQFRVAGLLKPLSLLSPIMGVGLAVGVGLANLTSPFGPYDFLVMPLVSLAASLIAYRMRKMPWLALGTGDVVALVVQAAIVAVGVAVFPLYLGGGIPLWPTLLMVFASEATLYLMGYAVLRQTPLWDDAMGGSRNDVNL